MLTAAGGGGDSNSSTDSSGGAGGGLNGEAGPGYSAYAGEGGGGSQTVGGVGGANWSLDLTTYGSPGTQYEGGLGISYGAGGGGGFFGGGGSSTPAPGEISGGGGGSSYLGDSSVLNAVTMAGVGAVQGNFSDPDGNGSGVGGAAGANGANGLVIIYYGTIQVVSASPSAGSHLGGGTIVLNGLGFSSDTVATIGGSICANVDVSNYQMSCIIPANPIGAADIVVTDKLSGYSVTLSNGYNYN